MMSNKYECVAIWAGVEKSYSGLESHNQFVNRISCNEGAVVPTEHWDLKGNFWMQFFYSFLYNSVYPVLSQFSLWSIFHFTICKQFVLEFYKHYWYEHSLQFIWHAQIFKQCLLQSKSLYELYDDDKINWVKMLNEDSLSSSSTYDSQ